MSLHYFKRTQKKVNRSRIAVFGPLNSDWKVPKGQQPQKLRFNLDAGAVAKCDLTPGKNYAIYAEMFCELGASLKCQIKAADSKSPQKDVASITVPENYDGKKTQLGYAYSDVRYFTA
jgi:hypothetical protein